MVEEFCDRVHIVVGYGFEDETDPRDVFVDAGNWDVEIRYHVVADWEEKENAYTCLRGLEYVEPDSDVLLLCGDVLFRIEAVREVIQTYNKCLRDDDFNAVAVIEGIQDEMTAVRWNDEGVIESYGSIRGHQEAGIFILNSHNREDAESVLEANQEEWFPIIFKETPSKPVFVDRSARHEVNTPEHLTEARKKYEEWPTMTNSSGPV
ncbi:hypothetical protein MBEHAL_2277 [Halarchaeum acidiphilum MH1-52-1]|uniref:Nucleotidyl transferase domain-containing protein n=2 Tax=Halarchaeum acidiphilum TaxID=489138 RepID=U2YXJ9_9EURY|nr:hypothetical protein MBEHAL_2277 [Halarchaeum acidiphilum MH1-52-1]